MSDFFHRLSQWELLCSMLLFCVGQGKCRISTLTSDPTHISGHSLSTSLTITIFLKFILETSLHNQQLSGYIFLFKQHKCFLCPEILELACARGGWKTLASSWKKWLIQGVRLVGGSETCTRSLPVSSSGTTVAGMCPEWARLPGLVVVLPVWILHTGGADWELNFTFHYLFARHCNECPIFPLIIMTRVYLTFTSFTVVLLQRIRTLESEHTCRLQDFFFLGKDNAGWILEVKLMFYCRALIIWNKIWNEEFCDGKWKCFVMATQKSLF